MKLLGNRGKIQNSIIFEDVDLKIHDDVDENILEDGDKEVDKMKSKGKQDNQDVEKSEAIHVLKFRRPAHARICPLRPQIENALSVLMIRRTQGRAASVLRFVKMIQTPEMKLLTRLLHLVVRIISLLCIVTKCKYRFFTLM